MERKLNRARVVASRLRKFDFIAKSRAGSVYLLLTRRYKINTLFHTMLLLDISVFQLQI
ncbi:MAG: hypothetical protein IPG53_23765 [Ignavibacteriales bacterium]|nr:hypothetical protein [Ignavibacteriales bacterium]